MVASERVVHLPLSGYELKDIKPGEAIFITLMENFILECAQIQLL